MSRVSSLSLDRWIGSCLGITGLPCQADVERYQMTRLRECLDYARRRSRFYRERYAGVEIESLRGPKDLERLPFLCAEDIRLHGDAMLCVPASQVERVVSLASSGSMGPPKRLCFSEHDLAATIDFFARGMATISAPGERVLICMNGSTPDSVGDLLRRGLERIGVVACSYGEIRDVRDAAKYAKSVDPHCIVGIPGQVLSLAEAAPSLAVRNVLLSADNVPDLLRRRVTDIWGCEIYAHWGMVETGLGGGVECAARDGYHLRHPDLLIEIVDPETGRILADGERGEIVVTTLAREAMPLFRYRTGDLSYLIGEPCRCGSVLKRLGPVWGHYKMEVKP